MDIDQDIVSAYKTGAQEGLRVAEAVVPRVIRQIDDFTDEIINAISKKIKAKYDQTVKIKAQQTLKTNGPQDALSVKFDGSNAAPTVYVKDLYDQYMSGKSVDEIAEKASVQAYEAYKNTPALPEFTAENARQSITLQLVNTERNEELLAKTPHYEVGDLSAIPRWQISDEASFIVKSDFASSLGLTDDEVLQIGMKNLQEEDFKIVPMSMIIKDSMIKDGMDPEIAESMLAGMEDMPMLVATTESGVQGSKVLLSEDALSQIHEKMGGDYIVLPSSLHEVICVPADSMDANELREIVHSVNMTEVSEQDYLSDNIFRCDGHKLTMITDDIKLDHAHVELPKLETDGMHF